VVAGVAGGLGDYTGVDPVLFRVLFAVLTVFGGAGILLYVVGWLFLPAEDEPVSPVESLIGRGSTGRRTGDVLLALVLVVLGLIFAGILADGDAGDVVLCLVVVGGLVLLIRNLDARRGGQPPAPLPPPTASPPPYQPYEPYTSYDPTRTAAMPAGPGGTATVVAPPPLPVVPSPPRERSILGRLTLSAMLVVLGITAALDAADAIEPDARHYLALAVGVLGLGLLVGAVRGRARGLIWLGIPLTVALVAVGTAEASLEGGTGERQYRPLSIVDLQDEYRVGVGRVEVDLTGLDFTEQSARTKVSAGVGEVEVVVPRDVDVTVVGDTGLGEAVVFGERYDGDSPDPTVVSLGPDGSGGGTLRLELQVGIGRVEVNRASS
jgi:phage shock protein PspC (stress-responsive transcriptional regulator)